jgi:hypothetical protein
LSVTFFVPESIACLLAIGLFSVFLTKAVGVGGLAIPFVWFVIHVMGCRHFPQEVELFLAAVGLDENQVIEDRAGAQTRQ